MSLPADAFRRRELHIKPRQVYVLDPDGNLYSLRAEVHIADESYPRYTEDGELVLPGDIVLTITDPNALDRRSMDQ